MWEFSKVTVYLKKNSNNEGAQAAQNKMWMLQVVNSGQVKKLQSVSTITENTFIFGIESRLK